MCFESFQTLPYPVQEHIIDLVDDFPTFLALAVASKYLSTLSSRSLYESLDFTTEGIARKRWPDLQPSIQISNLRFLQASLVSRLSAHPDLGVFARSLSWEISDDHSWSYGVKLPTEKVWKTFDKLNAIHTLDLKVNVGTTTPPPEVSLFPNLQVARIEGEFPKGSLEKILHASPYLRELRIVGKDTAEHRGYRRSIGTDITPFLSSSIEHGAFARLRILDLWLVQRATLDVVAEFLAMHSMSLVHLSIQLASLEGFFDGVFETHFLPVFQDNSWANLEVFRLVNAPVSSDDMDATLRCCAKLKEFHARWREENGAPRLLCCTREV